MKFFLKEFIESHMLNDTFYHEHLDFYSKYQLHVSLHIELIMIEN